MYEAKRALNSLQTASQTKKGMLKANGTRGASTLDSVGTPSPDKNLHGYFHGTSACLSALFAARRYDELIELVTGDIFWPYKRWAVKAMVAQRRSVEAIAYAERCRRPWASDRDIDRLCEQILLSAGQADEAYARYALTANRANTFSAGFGRCRRSTRTSHPAASFQTWSG